MSIKIYRFWHSISLSFRLFLRTETPVSNLSFDRLVKWSLVHIRNTAVFLLFPVRLTLSRRTWFQIDRASPVLSSWHVRLLWFRLKVAVKQTHTMIMMFSEFFLFSSRVTVHPLQPLLSLFVIFTQKIIKKTISRKLSPFGFTGFALKQTAKIDLT